MKARLRQFWSALGDAFWVVPALMVLGGILASAGAVAIDRTGLIPKWMVNSAWLYNGGGTGARTLLGAVASSTIGVAGTVFSITIAALTLASGQMGPRLLRNFTHDRGNQVTLGAFLGTFAYALMVLRTVRAADEGDFIPHLALSLGIWLAIGCVGMLVYFVGHMAGRINVETVVVLVSEDMQAALQRLTQEEPGEAPPPAAYWTLAQPVRDERQGYLQHLDESGLADWAGDRQVAIRLLVRPGDYVFPGAPIAQVIPQVDGVEAAIRDATALGKQRISSEDLEYAARQLVEVAVRALSPGINDPHTAMNVLDALGAALCRLAPRHLPTGVSRRDGRVALTIPAVDYDGLLDTMFHLIRQNAAGSIAVLIRMLEVLTAARSCERNATRDAGLQRHADLIRADAERDIANAGDLRDVLGRYATFCRLRHDGDGADDAAEGAQGADAGEA
ncbi:MAG TPA: DUF2254 domain-containing protein [Acidocella sp.]|nr:DUF2254 domain-containing protein [Acidocella sp.]